MSSRLRILVGLVAPLALCGCSGSGQRALDELAALRRQLQLEQQRQAEQRQQLAEAQRQLEEQRRHLAGQQQRLEHLQRGLDAQDLALRRLQDRVSAEASPAPTATDAPDYTRLLRRIGVNRYRLHRATLDKALGDLRSVARGVRVVPAVENGAPVGFRLFAIRPGSLVHALELRNGDLIARINGTPLTSPDRALEIYSKLRKATRVTVDVVRRGKRQQLQYTID